MNILDIDKLKSINDYISINTTNKFQTIYLLIRLIQSYGTQINKTTYKLCVRYLDRVIPLIYVFDDTCQFIDIKYETQLSTEIKCNLHIYLSYNDDPIIRWIESNSSVPTYLDIGRGEYLMNFAHCFLNFIGFSRVRLDDDSYLPLQQTNTKLKLWLYLLLTNGRSWYAKFGYVPSNTSALEYQLLISDLKSIRLDKIISRLRQREIKSELDTIIGDSVQTLEEYTKSHSLEECAVMFNTMFQSTFKTFFWYDIYYKLFLANICQTCDTINNFVQLGS